jgi:hypothetical protein
LIKEDTDLYIYCQNEYKRKFDKIHGIDENVQSVDFNKRMRKSEIDIQENKTFIFVIEDVKKYEELVKYRCACCFVDNFSVFFNSWLELFDSYTMINSNHLGIVKMLKLFNAMSNAGKDTEICDNGMKEIDERINQLYKEILYNFIEREDKVIMSDPIATDKFIETNNNKSTQLNFNGYDDKLNESLVLLSKIFLKTFQVLSV